ncbi:flagellar export chaperone FliS [Myxococcota bacterium]|nr:flagellar export chaperone FliS [Myxococcota bacterium]
MYAKNGYSQSSLQRYRAVKIQTASPAQIMLMLYDGAIRFTQIAKMKIEERDLAGKGTYIGKVQAIISELMSSLDFSIAPELCTQLQQLYMYMMEQLTEANIRLKTEPLDVVVSLLTTLREGWGQALTSLPVDPTLSKVQNGEASGAPQPAPEALPEPGDRRF